MRWANGLAHLVLVPNPPQHPAGDFTLEAGMVGNGPAPRYTYAGVAVMSPALVAGVSAGDKAPLAPLLRDGGAASAGWRGELFGGLWTDVGTLERLAELEDLAGDHDEHHRHIPQPTAAAASAWRRRSAPASP